MQDTDDRVGGSYLQYIGEQSVFDYELLPDNYGSNGLANSIRIPMAHKLFGFTVANTNANAQYILLFDQTSVPADGQVPDVVFQVAGATTDGVLWVPPRKMLRGIVLCNSTTAGTKTIGAADCAFDVQAR